MSQESILLVGAGGHAKACIDVIEREGRFSVKGLVGLSDEVGSQILDYSVLGTDGDLPLLLQECPNVLIAVGQIKSPEPRIRLFDQVKLNNCEFPAIVSPHAYVSPHSTLNAGTIVMHGAIINAGAVVGRNCIINSQSLIEHDVIISDHCHIATSATINGGVQIGLGTFVGSGSSVRQGTKIGEHCFIGMGRQVLSDCEAGALMP
ncbi:MAG: acetyltransferase [Nitrosomonadaceae bacterium]|nr:acetyltransferase [Nitrosomonadaceae bacterium]